MSGRISFTMALSVGYAPRYRMIVDTSSGTTLPAGSLFCCYRPMYRADGVQVSITRNDMNSVKKRHSVGQRNNCGWMSGKVGSVHVTRRRFATSTSLAPRTADERTYCPTRYICVRVFLRYINATLRPEDNGESSMLRDACMHACIW